MEFFRFKKDIPFMRHALVFNVISLITFLLAVFFLIHRGLHLSVEFTGGTLIEVNYAQAADLEHLGRGPVIGDIAQIGRGAPIELGRNARLAGRAPIGFPAGL